MKHFLKANEQTQLNTVTNHKLDTSFSIISSPM